MTEETINDVVRRFVTSSELAERAGFSGVQIHAAHGYLLSQFLSPLTNRRTDRWGGPLENRARLLIEVVQAVRMSVSRKFCVSVKLNSADFQRGGFNTADAGAVIEMLNGLAVDLVEISGGTYEAPAMRGDSRDGRTLAREAYFLEFAKDMMATARMPLMLTGGISSREVAERVLASGIACTLYQQSGPNAGHVWRFFETCFTELLTPQPRIWDFWAVNCAPRVSTAARSAARSASPPTTWVTPPSRNRPLQELAFARDAE